MSKIPTLKIKTLPFNNKLICDVFNNNHLVTGPHIQMFEDTLAKTFNFEYANSTSNGFSALFLALKSFKLRNAKIVVPAISTCLSINNAVLACGFDLLFCDIDPFHLSLSESHLEQLFNDFKIDAIIAPSHFGIPAPIDIYKKFGVPIIEDACQSFYTRTLIQSHADIMVLSFYPTKQFNCIEGGAILHNSNERNNMIEDLRYYDKQLNYDEIVRYNFRMENLHAAFGCLAFENLTSERNALKNLRDEYKKKIKNQNLLLSKQCEENIIPWRFILNSSDIDFFTFLNHSNVQSNNELLSISNNSFSSDRDWIRNYFSIPFYSTLNLEDQNFIINTINTWS
jgi:dTDP-4-amino-4,6-dideoxygalactose transaminase